MHRLASKLLIMGTLTVALYVPASASARVRMTGGPKETAVFGLFAIAPGNHGDIWTGTANEPSQSVEAACYSAFESTVNNNWAVVYPANGTKSLCATTAADGVTIENLERWTSDDQTTSYWTPTTAFDEDPCGAGHYVGEPQTPRKVIDDLFGIRCPTDSFGNLPGTE